MSESCRSTFARRGGKQALFAVAAALAMVGTAGFSHAPCVTERWHPGASVVDPAVEWLKLQGATAMDTVPRLGWMEGCWRGTLAGGATYEEVWLAPLDGSMLGMARMSRDGRALSFEFMRIENDGETAIFSAQPSGRPATEFRAVETGPDSVLFANEGHDFPQRVRYRLVPPDSLHATIEGHAGEQRRSFHFPLGRSLCPGAAER